MIYVTLTYLAPLLMYINLIKFILTNYLHMDGPYRIKTLKRVKITLTRLLDGRFLVATATVSTTCDMLKKDTSGASVRSTCKRLSILS